VKQLDPDRYQVVAGERRLLAARRANFESMPCLVLDDNEEALDYQLAENFHRKDLDPLAKAYVVQLLKEKHIEEKKVSRLLGVSPATITQWTKILEVAPKFQQAVVDNFNDKSKSSLTIGHLAAVVVKGFSKELINEILDLVMDHHLSREKTEQLVKLMKNNLTLQPKEALRQIMSLELGTVDVKDQKEHVNDSRRRFVLVVPPTLPAEPEKREEIRVKFQEHLIRLDDEIKRLFDISLADFIHVE
jgi:ParB/RepB/Spo0J family partition protein